MRAIVRDGVLCVAAPGLPDGLEVRLVQADEDQMDPAERAALAHELEAALLEAETGQRIPVEDLWK